MSRAIGVAILAAVALAAMPAAGWAGPERFALVIGNNVGDGLDAPLRYAEDDAARLADVLTEIGGYPTENVVVARRLDGTAVRRALISINDRIRRTVATPGAQAVLFVYYSGHADAEALHLGQTRFDVPELRQLVSGSAAQFRILVLDACRSGALTRVKGGAPGPAFDIRVDDRLAGEGMVSLTSAAANEDAQESDAVRGSIFTHYLVSGLLGAADVDGDGRVSLAEVYRYAYDATVRTSSRTLAGAQHPTFQFQLRGQGDLPITTPGETRRERGVLVVPAGRSYLVMRGGAGGAVVAEVAAADQPRRLSVPAGRYFVRGRRDVALLEGAVDVAPAQATTVDESKLERIEYARLVRKGNGERPRIWAATGGYQIRTPLWRGARPCQGAFAALTLVTAAVVVEPRVGFCLGGYDNAYVEAATDEVDTALAVFRAWDLGRFVAAVGGEAGTAVLLQRFTAMGPAPGRTTGAPHAGLEGQLEWALPHGLRLAATLGLRTYFFPQHEADGTRWTAAPTVRASLGLGRYW